MNQSLPASQARPRRRRRLLLAFAGLVILGLTIWALPATASSEKQVTAKATTVVVSAGRPTELSFTLSKSSALPFGAKAAARTITFKVTNKGAITHNFKICTKPVTSAKANTCVGKATKMLKKGQSAKLTITFKKRGKYEFLCSVPGHAAGGMKGLLGVGVVIKASKVVKPKPTTTPTATTTTATTTTAAPGTCAQPARATTVNVGMIDFAFNMSTTSIPCGRVTFNTVNQGQAPHNFTVLAVGAAGVGPIIDPGASASFTVSLNPGTYNTQCDVPTHAALGMTGVITVTA